MATYFIQQKVTPFANQYRVFADVEGKPGELIAFVHQKRFALRENVLFYSDETKKKLAFRLQAQKINEFTGVYDVLDDHEQILGTLRKQFTHSLLRSTWRIRVPEEAETEVIVTERSLPLAILRRTWKIMASLIPYADFVPFFLRYHFDFLDAKSRQAIGGYDKIAPIWDHYKLTVSNDLEKIDWRVLVAQAVALDALQGR